LKIRKRSIDMFGNKIISIVNRRSNLKKLENFINSGLPHQMLEPLKYLITGKSDTTTNSVIKLAEDRRASIADQGEKKVAILYSPKPGSSGEDSSISALPQPGKTLEFTMERIANTGKSKRWGTFLYLVAKNFQSKFAIELGSCAGISAIYLASSPYIKNLITVGGSEPLANIAQESLKKYPYVKVVNSFFDEAIESEIEETNKKIDLAFIDGHHEKVATIHYYNRLLPFFEPGSVVIFDDISWSHDMHKAWNILSKRKEFSHAMDCGAVGVCILNISSERSQAEPLYWDLQPLVGRVPIGDPHGWKK
jgi:predicted O-methyltransferase YrrM